MMKNMGDPEVFFGKALKVDLSKKNSKIETSAQKRKSWPLKTGFYPAFCVILLADLVKNWPRFAMSS